MGDKEEEKCEYTSYQCRQLIDMMRFPKGIKRFIADSGVQLAFFLTLIFTQEGRDILKHPRWLMKLLTRDGNTGLLEQSIIQNPLYAPNTEIKSHLKMMKSNNGWDYSAYDFNRKSRFGKKTRNEAKGRIYSFLLDEIIQNSKDSYTPVGSFNLITTDIFYFEKPSIDYLLKYGLLDETTYSKAYRKVGLYEKYAKRIEMLNIAENKVFQVTPKGNGLIFLGKEGGEKVKKRNKVKDFKRSFVPGM